jgi:hypothetical protein
MPEHIAAVGLKLTVGKFSLEHPQKAVYLNLTIYIHEMRSYLPQRSSKRPQTTSLAVQSLSTAMNISLTATCLLRQLLGVLRWPFRCKPFASVRLPVSDRGSVHRTGRLAELQAYSDR